MSGKTTREELDFFIDNPLLGIVYLDKQYRIIRCNMKFEEMFGYKLEEIKSKNLDEIIDGDQDMTMISQNGESIHGSGKRNKKDGTIIEVEIYGIPKISGKTRIGTLGIYLDITERKLAEETIVKSQHELEERVKERTAELIRVNEQLQEEIVVREQTQKKLIESEDKYRTYVEHANDGISVVHKGKITFVNSRLAEIIGFKVDELVGKDFLQFIPKSKLNQITDNLKRRLSGEEVPQVYESRILHKDGSEIDVEFNITTIEANDEPATLTIIRDITERKQAEVALRESEEKYKAIFNNAQVALFRTGISDGKLVEINERYANMAGYSNIEDCMAEFNAADAWADPNARNELLRILKEKGSINDYETEIIRRDGSPLWIIFSATIFPEQGLLEGSIVDINEHKQAEEALEDSEALLVQTGRMAKIGGWILDAKTLEVTWTEETYRIHEVPLGHKPPLEEAIKFFHSDDRPKLETAIKKALEHGESYDMEVRFITAKGKRLWTHTIGKPIIEEGKTVKLTGTFQDITERKQAEEALRESEERYRNILENIGEGYYEIDLAGNFTFFNEAMCRIRGYSRNELMGMNNREYMDPVTAKKVFEVYNQIYTTGRGIKGYGWGIIRKDGTKGYVEVSASLMKNSEDKPIGFRGIVRDVTERKFLEEERKRLETQFQQAQKMEAISTLAGGIAHEFNNALMGIMGNIELLKIDLPEDERRDRFFEAMNVSGHRMSRLTDQLLAYSQGGKYQPKNLKLDDFVIETLPIMQHELSLEVRVETHFSKDLSFVNADNAQMQMVLSAILANSNEAIEDEGIIRITAENKDVDDDLAKQLSGLRPGPYVCLTVEDDGKGMDEQTRSGIFEPFFTTKFQGRGMGMAAVYGIVKNHDGWIYVDSELGKGTTVRIYLPAIEIEIEKPKEAEAEIPTGSGTILMIEDEDMVIDVTRTMLEMLGYRVMVAKTGKDAIHVAETFDGQIDLALLDIKLPDISGINLYPLIMKARSNLKVIVWSGYSIDGPAREILDAGAQDFIHKPFTFATLSEKLKEVLEGE